MSTNAHAHDPELADPHGFTGGHEGHVILRTSTLVTVLMILLFFTVLTVAASRAETWASAYFNITIPQWVNVAVVLSIAVVKSAFVALFFMQLKYDNPLNGLVFLFCLFALGLFLFFSMTDLGTRAAVYPEKAGEFIVGGTGLSDAPGKPLAVTKREQAIERMGPEKFAEAEAAAHADHAHEDHGPASSANRSRPKKGLTGALDPHPADPAGSGAKPAGH